VPPFLGLRAVLRFGCIYDCLYVYDRDGVLHSMAGHGHFSLPRLYPLLLTGIARSPTTLGLLYT
jgi:hypothetical protein